MSEFSEQSTRPKEPKPAGASARPSTASARTVVFIDLVRFTSLTDIHGDLAGADAATDLLAATERSIGLDVRLIKSLGDGVLLCASSPEPALRCAERITHEVHHLGRGLDVRAGADHGAVVERKGDLFGGTVNTAARAATVPEPGSIAVTRPVALAAGALGLGAAPLGDVLLEGFRDGVELFSIDICDHDGAWVTDPVCGMRLDPGRINTWIATDLEVVGFCSTGCAELFERLHVRGAEDSSG